jgi:anaerobic magnesium-protoporphyrin IX monomethyl ester cyclase
MASVLLGQSYYLRFDPKLWAAMQPYPPLGTLYAASYLRERGHKVALFDAMLSESEEEWGDAVQAQRPEFAIIYEDNFNYLSKMCLLRMREAAFRMLAMARLAGCRTIVCGSDATDNAARYMDAGAEFVIHGEGELTLAELLDSLEGRSARPLEEIHGLAFRAADGRDVDTGRRPSMRDLDALPFPAWDLVDVDRYRAAWAGHGRFSMNMVTTRGCPFHCNWCAKPIWGQRYAVRSPANVAAELAWLKRTYGPDHISFADDILGLNPAWLEKFASIVHAQGIETPFKCLSRADLLLRPGEIEALKAAGCEMVWTGAESGSQRVLDAMDKGTRVEQIREAAARLRAAGIRFGFFLQFGYPGEGWSDIERTRRLVLDCLPDDIGISVSYPLPGTPFYERVRAQLGERQNWFDSADLAMLYRGPFPTRFYRRLHVAIHKEFRLHKAMGTAAPPVHVVAAVRSLGRRKTLARVRDAFTLPFDRAQLAVVAGLELVRPDRRAMRTALPTAAHISTEAIESRIPRSRP